MDDFKKKIEDIKNQLSNDDIISLVCGGLGSDGYKEDASGNLIFQTVDHNEKGEGKYKLYYYPSTQIFVSYTGTGSMDVFELVKQAKGYDSFYAAYQYVCNFFNVCTSDIDAYRGFNAETETEFTADWDILNKVADYSKTFENKEKIESKILPETLLQYYYKGYPMEWLREGYNYATMDKFGIRVDPAGSKIIIPHYDVYGNLIGIRGRSYDKFDLDKGMKYSPVWIGETMYNSPLGAHLYGLDKVKETIKRTKRVCIVEAEKSVLKSWQWYGNNSYTVATCGSSGLSQEQLKLLMDLGVNSITVAYDKENGYVDGVDKTTEYEQKLLRLFQPLTAYFDVSVVFDYQGVLQLKDSPLDHSKDVFEYLLNNKFRLPPIDENTLKSR